MPCFQKCFVLKDICLDFNQVWGYRNWIRVWLYFMNWDNFKMNFDLFHLEPFLTLQTNIMASQTVSYWYCLVLVKNDHLILKELMTVVLILKGLWFLCFLYWWFFMAFCILDLNLHLVCSFIELKEVTLFGFVKTIFTVFIPLITEFV